MNENYKNNNLSLDKLESLPKNVRQIGEAREGNRIYMEDYVYSYLHQFAMDKKTVEQIAFLIGKNYTYNGDAILIIEGAIKGNFAEKVNGDLCITERTWYHVYEKVRRYFEEYNVVGWMYTQPGYGILLTSFLKEHHSKNFIDDKQVLYIVDPLEKEDTFFVYENGELHEKRGYYIYYDKNPAMHRYILAHKIQKEEVNEKDIDINNDIVRTFRRKEKERKDDIYQKKFINMLSILCGGLVLICLVMGIGLLNNIEKLNELQTAMNTMTQKYNSIKKEVGDLGDNKKENNTTDNQLNPTSNIETNETDSSIQTTEDVHNNQDIDNSPSSDTSNNTEAPNSDSSDNQEASTVSTTPPNTTTISANDVPKTYVVQVGDSLNTISEKFYYTLDMVPAIQEINGINNPHRIYIGQEILLPRP